MATNSIKFSLTGIDSVALTYYVSSSSTKDLIVYKTGSTIPESSPIECIFEGDPITVYRKSDAVKFSGIDITAGYTYPVECNASGSPFTVKSSASKWDDQNLTVTSNTNETVELYATEQSATYYTSIIYDVGIADGAYNMPSNQNNLKSPVREWTISLRTTKPVWTNYVFTGWYCEDDGNIYQPGDDFVVYGTENGSSYKLIAQWEKSSSSGEDEFDYIVNVYTYVGGVRKNTEKFTFSEKEDTVLIDVREYVDSIYFSNYTYLGFSFVNTGADDDGYYAEVSSGEAQSLYVWFTSNSSGEDDKYSYSYEVYVCVDDEEPVLIESNDDWTSNNSPEELDLSVYIDSSDYEEYTYLGFSYSSSGEPDNSEYIAEITEGQTNKIYLWFQTSSSSEDYYYQYEIYACVDGADPELIDSGETTSPDNPKRFNIKTYAESSDYSDYVYIGFTYYETGYTPDDSTYYVELAEGPVNEIYLWFESSPYYPFTLRVRINDEREYDYDVEKDDNTNKTIVFSECFEELLSSTAYAALYSNTYLGYRKSSSGILREEDSYTFSNHSAVVLYVEFQTAQTVTVTFEHYRGKKKYGDSTTVVFNYGAEVDGSTTEYHKTDIPCCIYGSSDNAFEATTNDQIMKIYYKYRWDNPPKTGNPWEITAKEWNYLRDFIDDQRLANGNAKSGLIDVSRDEIFTFTHYNNMWKAIGKGTEVQRWQEITQALMDELVTNANAMAGL